MKIVRLEDSLDKKKYAKMFALINGFRKCDLYCSVTENTRYQLIYNVDVGCEDDRYYMRYYFDKRTGELLNGNYDR